MTPACIFAGNSPVFTDDVVPAFFIAQNAAGVWKYYIEAAQDAAIEQALSNAGFDVQFVPVRHPNQQGENAKAAQPPEPVSKPSSVQAGASPKAVVPSQEEKRADSATAVEKANALVFYKGLHKFPVDATSRIIHDLFHF